jgi:hypothetical protein
MVHASGRFMSLSRRAAWGVPGAARTLGGALCCLALVACSSSATPGRDAGTGGAGLHPDTQVNETMTNDEDGGQDLITGVAPEVPATDISCNQIRICAASCTTSACLDACVKRGTAPARVLFEGWASCVTPLCMDIGDITCRCEASCFGGSDCEEQTGACAGEEVDYVCDELCH